MIRRNNNNKETRLTQGEKYDMEKKINYTYTFQIQPNQTHNIQSIYQYLKLEVYDFIAMQLLRHISIAFRSSLVHSVTFSSVGPLWTILINFGLLNPFQSTIVHFALFQSTSIHFESSPKQIGCHVTSGFLPYNNRSLLYSFITFLIWIFNLLNSGEMLFNYSAYLLSH